MKYFIVLVLFANVSLFAFSSSNIQLLMGNFDGNSAVYDTNDGGLKTTFTYERISANEVGDLFAFVDYTVANDTMLYTQNKTAFYGEFSPRLSLSYLTSQDLSFSVFSNFYLATQLNAGSGADFRAGLIGLGTDIKIKGFDYFSLNLYYKHVALVLPDPAKNFIPSNVRRDTVQLSSSYGSSLVTQRFSLNGWLDWSGYSFQTQTQLLYDVYVSETKSKLQVGVEHLYYYELRNDFTGSYKSNRPISNVLQGLLKYQW